MAARRQILVFFQIIVLLMMGGIISACHHKNTDSAGISVDQFTAELKMDGFEVAQGYFQLWRIEDCPESFDVMGTCYFNNPTAPYVMSVLPFWPDEYIDPATKNAFGSTKLGCSTSFRFDPNEAIVIFGFLPPKAVYFGLQSYLFTRKDAYKTDNDTYNFINRIGAKDVFFHTVPGRPAQDRILTFDSLSDSKNNVVIERQSDGSFGQFRYFIITPDRYMDQKIRRILHNLSVADQDIFTEGIPANMRIGLGEDADDFVSGIRYSLPEDGGKEGTPSDIWRNNPPLSILRIRTSQPHPPQPYPAWEDNSPEPRKAVSEADLKDDLNLLVQKVSQAWGQPCIDTAGCSDKARSFIDTQSSPFNLVGPLCDNIGMDCLADTQDATYQFSGGYEFDNGEVYAVIGTLGTATGNASYVSLGVNNFRLRLGAENVDGSKLEGSVKPEWYPGVNNLDKLYIYYFTRNCEDEKVQELTHGFCLSVKDTELVVPPGDKVSLVERDYMAPGTQRGPNSKLTLPSMVLILQKPGQ
ncbi:MAG: hypothetical protein PHW80_00920 [Smithellaceae bacterium]|jgi:hypothetical protein|nr:hypothetical protein [Smithellaceae bacterium]MDD3847850.1 hypothetical protein [Smithellaceae bacterium]